MKKVFLTGILFAVGLLLFACGGFSVKMIGSWMDDSKAGYTVDNVLVIGISREDVTRNLWEDTLVELLGKQNIKAQAGHIVMDNQVIKPDRESILAAVRKSGAGSVLITRVIGHDTETTTRPGGVVYFRPEPYYMGMGDFYGSAYDVAYRQPVYSTETNVRLESNLYDAASEKLVWTAQTEAVDPKLLKSDYAKMVNLLLDDMRKKKLL